MANSTNATTNTTKTLDELLDELNTATTKEGITTAMAAIEQACKAENDARMTTAIDGFLAMADDRKAMFTAFINAPCIATVRIKQNAKTQEYEKANGIKQIPFSKLESAYQSQGGEKHADGTVDSDTSKTLAQSKRYHAMLNYFVDNISRAIAGDLSEQVKKVSVPKMTKGSDNERKEFDFSGTSTNALEAQLNAIVSTILPEDMPIKMLRVDVKALKQASTTEKMMSFTMSNEARMLNKIFSALEIRMNNKAYTLTSKAKVHKQDKKNLTANENGSEVQEAEMSKVPERAGADKVLGKKEAAAAA